ncbi:hypothetical protein DFH07DRAFT_991037 [Mycena maculata]|uniref:Uncharacterized protein n=1 Tax=Mycena maculata TaxID=230809 RepID=A0AAD7HZM2_9AGAR|nr:hypothetical protein DFH07DRAFT_991037 [Mycena maculata]
MALLPDSTFVRTVLEDLHVSFYVFAAEALLYGAYVIMFNMHVLHTRGISNNPFLAITTISLFLLCTTHFALLLASTIVGNEVLEDLVVGAETNESTLQLYRSLDRAANIIYVTNKFLMIPQTFRCYAIWNFRRKVVIIPILLTVAVAVFGYFNIFSSIHHSGTFENVPFITLFFGLSITMSLVTTFILMGLSGQLMYITSRYYTICAMILESGAVGGILFVVMAFRETTNATTSGAVLGQLVGIAPAIIAVRVGPGGDAESVRSFVVPACPTNSWVPLETQSTVVVVHEIM